jgi:hypothetical protein
MYGSPGVASATALIIAALIPLDAASAEPTTAPAPATVDELQAELKSLQVEQQDADARIKALQKRILELEVSGLLNSQSRVPDASAAQMRGRGIGDADAEPAPPSPSPASAPAADETTRKEPAKSEAVEAVTRSEQGYFGHAFTLEPGLSYSHFSTAQLNLSGFLALDAIFLGLISIDQTDADVVTADVTGRYGIGRFQADVDVPYLYRRSNFRSGGAGGNASGLIERTITSRGLGDVSAGLSYRMWKETSSRPDVVFNIRAKAPTGIDPFGVELIEVDGSEGNLKIPSRLSTGTGVWGAAAGVSVLKTIDPMVVFGSFTYFYNFKHHFPDVDDAIGDQPGEALLGDAFQYGLGVAFALNDRSSLNTSFTERFVRHSKLRLDPADPTADAPWQTVVGSEANVGVLNLGATFSLTDRLTLLTNLGVGITQDAPDMTVMVRVPYQF